MPQPDYPSAHWRPAAEGNWGPRPPGVAIDCIVLHATVGSLAASLAWFENPTSGVAAHYVAARNGSVYQMVEEAYLAHHAGASAFQGRRNFNAFSIGIEMVNKNDGHDPYPSAQLEAVTALVRHLVAKHTIQRQWVVTHAQISTAGKTDPRAFPLADLLERVYEEVDRPLEEVIRFAAWEESGIQYNPDAAFAKYARAHDLGKPETNEFDLEHEGIHYRAQGFSRVILYCEVGDWANIQELVW